MRLFADLYFDEDFSVVVAKILQASGSDTLTTVDANILNRSDEEQLNFAAKAKRCLITHNRLDFEKLHSEYIQISKKHYGIIIANRRKESELARRISRFLNQFSSDEIEDQLFYV